MYLIKRKNKYLLTLLCVTIDNLNATQLRNSADTNKRKKKFYQNVDWTFLRMPQSFKMDIFFSMRGSQRNFWFFVFKDKKWAEKVLSRMRVCQFIARFFRHVTERKKCSASGGWPYLCWDAKKKMGAHQGQMIRGPGWSYLVAPSSEIKSLFFFSRKKYYLELS